MNGAAPIGSESTYLLPPAGGGSEGKGPCDAITATEAVLDRTEAVNPKINALVTLMADAADAVLHQGPA